jgi:hypothetical protein
MDKLNEIATANSNSYSGCWDVVAWQNERLLFVELKRFRHDNIRSTQIRWLEAGLDSGLTLDNFLVVEWVTNLREFAK